MAHLHCPIAVLTDTWETRCVCVKPIYHPLLVSLPFNYILIEGISATSETLHPKLCVRETGRVRETDMGLNKSMVFHEYVKCVSWVRLKMGKDCGPKGTNSSGDLPLSSHHSVWGTSQTNDNLSSSPSLQTNNITAACVCGYIISITPEALTASRQCAVRHTLTVSLSRLQNLFWQLLLGTDLQSLQGVNPGKCVCIVKEGIGEGKCYNLHFEKTSSFSDFWWDKICREKGRNHNKKRFKSHKNLCHLSYKAPVNHP